MPDDSPPPFSRKWLVGILLAGVGVIATLMLTDAYEWIKAKLGDPEPEIVKIDFQATNGCPLGRLLDIRDKRFADTNVQLTNGAEKLVICDDEALSAQRNELPGKIADKYKGCLRYQQYGGGLILLRKSPAVCGTPDGKAFICDGANGRRNPGLDATGENQPVVTCPPDLLQRFGFS